VGTKSSSDPGLFTIEVGEKLRKLREEVRRLSPEELAAKVREMDGQVSPSYIRRIEKGEHSPTVEMLDMLLRALNSNMGLFFEYQIDQSADQSARDRRLQRIVQRALEGPYGEKVAGMIEIIAKIP
jgi:transcriptional regulator with XRE-family HTH domain